MKADWQQRFWGKVDKTEGCWLWHGRIQRCARGGYGLFELAHGKTVYAHRTAYELAIGPIPAELCIDHLCRNRACVNPAHMEVVTPYVNMLRGTNRAARNARKTHCQNGHAFTSENTYLYEWHGRITRHCRRCIQARWATKRHRDVSKHDAA